MSQIIEEKEKTPPKESQASRQSKRIKAKAESTAASASPKPSGSSKGVSPNKRVKKDAIKQAELLDEELQ